MMESLAQLVCKWLLILLLLGQFLKTTKVDFEGTAKQDPKGFEGFIATMLAFGTLALLYYGAGVFDDLLTLRY